MTIAILSGLLLGAAGLVWGLICQARLSDAKHEADAATVGRDSALRALNESVLARNEARGRYEALLADRQKQITELSDQLAAASLPGATAARLTGFFGRRP